MQMTIEIPDNLPNEIAIKQIRIFEMKLKKEAELFKGQSIRYDNQALDPNVNHQEKQILEKIKILVENGDVSEARILLSCLPDKVLSPALDNWRKKLAVPKVKQEKSATGGSLKEDAAWIQKNATSYKGKWVASKQRAVFLLWHDQMISLDTHYNDLDT